MTISGRVVMIPEKWWSVASMNKRRSWGGWFAHSVQERRNGEKLCA